jgi:hypothetical protein
MLLLKVEPTFGLVTLAGIDRRQLHQFANNGAHDELRYPAVVFPVETRQRS